MYTVLSRRRTWEGRAAPGAVASFVLISTSLNFPSHPSRGFPGPDRSSIVAAVRTRLPRAVLTHTEAGSSLARDGQHVTGSDSRDFPDADQPRVGAGRDGVPGSRDSVRGLRPGIRLDGGRAALLPRQGSEERAEALQALQAGEERAPRGHRQRAGVGRAPAHRGLRPVRAVRPDDDRPVLPFAGTARLLPLVLHWQPRRGRP